MFQTLQAQPNDPLLALIGLFHCDPRKGKIDLGIGTYRNEQGITPVMAAVKAAEQQLLDTQRTKTYLGPGGDQRFVELLASLAFGRPGASTLAGRLRGVQAPGGSGALRLGAELVATARPDATVWLGTPTWPNHRSIFDATRLKVAEYRYYDPVTHSLCIGDMLAALKTARTGDVVLLHGCCHNPTGAELSQHRWDEIADLLNERGLLPFIDLAYQGLGRGTEADAYGVRRVLMGAEEALVAYSCDKNFGLYRDRTGALFTVARTAAAAGVVLGNLLALAHANWGMPPDHGAAVVRIILESGDLACAWRAGLDAMRGRIDKVRGALAAADPRLAFLTDQRGMFSQLPITERMIASLRNDHSIYMAGNGRINLAGLRSADVDAFVDALAAVGALGLAPRVTA